MRHVQGRRESKWVLALVAVLAIWGAFPGVAAAAECPVDEPLTPSTVGEAARQVFERGPGVEGEKAVAGLERAEDAVPDRIRRLSGSVAPELATDGDAKTNEFTAAVELGVRLGRLTRVRRKAAEADTAARRAERDRARAAYIYRVQQTYLDWWTAAVEKHHLAAYEKEVRKELKPLREAADDKKTTSLAMADFDVELGRIEAQRVKAGRRATVARADLREVLGTECPLQKPDMTFADTDGSGKGSPGTDDNPWTALLDRVDEFPEVQALVAERKRAVQRAEAADSDAAPELSVGAGARSVGFKEFWVIPQVGVTIPLGNPSKPEAEKYRGLAAGLSAERRWRVSRIRAEIQAGASRWRATRDARRRLVDGYLEPLRERNDLFEKALDRGRIRLERFLRARRALHEAEHDLLLLKADLMARTLRAEALLDIVRSDH